MSRRRLRKTITKRHVAEIREDFDTYELPVCFDCAFGMYKIVEGRCPNCGSKRLVVVLSDIDKFVQQEINKANYHLFPEE